MDYLMLCLTRVARIGIIVRHKAAKESLQEIVGEAAIILLVSVLTGFYFGLLTVCRTIYEAKGLEFDDVSIGVLWSRQYNTFKTNPGHSMEFLRRLAGGPTTMAYCSCRPWAIHSR